MQYAALFPKCTAVEVKLKYLSWKNEYIWPNHIKEQTIMTHVSQIKEQ